MSEEQEGGVGVSDGRKKAKLSKKARMKLRRAAGGGVGVVVMKRKGDGVVGLKGKGRDGGGSGDGDLGEAGSKKRNRKKRNKKGIRVAEVAGVVEEGSDGPEGEVVAAAPPRRSEGGKRLSYLDKVGSAYALWHILSFVWSIIALC